jgi:sensor histidine kinase YesM
VNIYSKKIRWKFFLFVIATLIGLGSLYYTNKLVQKLSLEERKKVELWAEATHQVIQSEDSDKNFGFLLKVIQNNETVPVMWVDAEENIITTRNLDENKVDSKEYLKKKLQQMKDENPPLEIELPGNIKQYIYYGKSTLLTRLIYYPYVQLGMILLFILVAYYAFSSSRKAEQNQVWVGLSKETAHQLGTPISSLLAWLEVMKLKAKDKQLLPELEKDVRRLEKITERFSKIGARPKLESRNIQELVQQTVNYLKSRVSDKIVFKLQFLDDKILVPINYALFEWVIENVCKNAIDAIEGEGEIKINVIDNTQVIYIDVADTGKGIAKSKYKTIFKPGFTTKDRGWGLGLSLTKRIVEEYHDGKIFVLDSEANKGTTIRIVLKKYI